jgi:hypothetical protein
MLICLAVEIQWSGLKIRVAAKRYTGLAPQRVVHASHFLAEVLIRLKQILGEA